MTTNERLEEIRKDLERGARPWYDTDIRFLLSLVDSPAVQSAREAAEEIVDEIDFKGPSMFSLREQKVKHFEAIITKHCAAQPTLAATAPNPSLARCLKCQHRSNTGRMEYCATCGCKCEFAAQSVESKGE